MIRHRLPPLAALLAVVTLLVAADTACSPSTDPDPTAVPSVQVVTDGRFDEWADVPALLADPVDVATDAAVDLGTIQATSDGHYLYFTLDMRRPVNAQAMLGSVSILLDADMDAGSGTTVADLSGVDLVLELSRRDQANAEGFGSGIATRSRTTGGELSERSNASEWGVVVSPTFAADRFELRIRRGGRAADGSVLLTDDSTRVRLVFSTPEGPVDYTDIAGLGLAPFDGNAEPSRWLEPLERRSGDIRVLVWNVSSESFRDRPEKFARVITAVEPDVLLLDEVFGEVTAADVDDFLGRIGAKGATAWEYVLGTSGGRQKTVVASRRGVRLDANLQDLSYPAETLDALESRFPAAKQLFDLERERGLASVGAWVDVAGHPVLFVPIDLQSAGYDGSFHDELRKLQAKTLNDYVAAALLADGRGGSVVIGGDLNLVGSRDPLDLLMRGLDNGADLIAVDTYRLTDRSMATWRNPNLPFTPGRLDFVLIPSSTFAVERAFPFDGGELSDELRNALGVEADDFTTTSDHLPLVVDLRLKGNR